MRRLANPFLAAVAGLLVGVGLGIGVMLWRQTSAPHIEDALQKRASLVALLENPAVEIWNVLLQGDIQSILSDSIVLVNEEGAPVTVKVVGDSPQIYDGRSNTNPTPLRLQDLKPGYRVRVQAQLIDGVLQSVSIVQTAG